MNIWKWIKRAILFAVFLVVSHFLYQLQLGAIPALLLSFYLFRLAWKEIRKNKQSSQQNQELQKDKNKTEKDKSYEKAAKVK